MTMRFEQIDKHQVISIQYSDMKISLNKSRFIFIDNVKCKKEDFNDIFKTVNVSIQDINEEQNIKFRKQHTQMFKDMNTLPDQFYIDYLYKYVTDNKKQQTNSQKPTQEQQQILDHIKQNTSFNINVKSLAGTGKSTLLAQILQQQRQQRILYLTFNVDNKEQFNKKYQTKIAQTMCAFKLKILKQIGYELNQQKANANLYDFFKDHKIRADVVIDSKNLIDYNQQQVSIEQKKRNKYVEQYIEYIHENQFTFIQMELINEILNYWLRIEYDEVSQIIFDQFQYDIIMIDEGQDLTKQDIQIVFNTNSTSKIIVFDQQQNIYKDMYQLYDQRFIDQNDRDKFIKEKFNIVMQDYSLNLNFRSQQLILDEANRYMKSFNTEINLQQGSSNKSTNIQTIKNDQITEILKEEIKKDQTIAVICVNNKELFQLREQLLQQDILCYQIMSKHAMNQQTEQQISENQKYLNEKIQLITTFKSKGLEYDTVIILQNYKADQEQFKELHYVNITRAKQNLYYVNYQ